MRGGVSIGALVALTVTVAAPAYAEHVAIPDAHGEPDVADEAVAVTLLVRDALAHDAGTLVAADAPIALAHAAAACATLGADHVVLLDVARDGTGLRATFAIASAAGALELSTVRAGDGDIAGLATGIVDKIAAVTGARASAVPAISLGALRPFAAALRERSDPHAAAAALADAVPGTAVTVPAAVAALAPVIAAIAADHTAGVDARAIAARSAGATDALEAIAKTGGNAAAGAHALAALDRLDTAGAEAAVGALPASDPVVALAQAALAERRADDARLNALLEAGLAGDHARAFAAFAATVTPSRLTAAVHRALLALAERVARAGDAPGVAARIGAVAAGAGIDRDRALALITARELAADEVAELAPLLAGISPGPSATTSAGAPATALRLRAELAMRRGDPAEAAAIAAFAAGAPGDARAQRYLGWRLAGQRQWKDAAAALAKAVASGDGGASRELARARLLAGDARRAAAEVHGTPSADDLAAQAQVALDDGHADEAARLVDRAELAAAADPLVAHVAVAVATARHDDAHAALARKIAALGDADAHGTSGDAGATAATDATNPGSAAGVPAELTAAADPEVTHALSALLAQLPLGHVHHIAIAALPARTSWLHSLHDERIAPALAAALRDAHIAATSFDRGFEDAGLAATDPAIARTRRDADALLLYQADTGSRVELVLYRVGAPAPDAFAGEVPTLVAWNVVHCAELAAAAAALAVALLLALRARATGRLDVTIERAPDASEEVYCVEVSHSANRPSVGELAKFHAATRAAGPTAGKRTRTLIGATTSFRLPAGRWHVHLYGAFERGGTLRAVPDTASKDVEVRRGRTATVAFDLAPALAEVHIQVRGGKRVTVATTDRDKVYADGEGRAVLMLPVGNHTVIVEHVGGVVRRAIGVPAARVLRISIDLRGDMPSSVAHGSAPAVSIASLHRDSAPGLTLAPTPEPSAIAPAAAVSRSSAVIAVPPAVGSNAAVPLAPGQSSSGAGAQRDVLVAFGTPGTRRATEQREAAASPELAASVAHSRVPTPRRARTADPAIAALAASIDIEIDNPGATGARGGAQRRGDDLAVAAIAPEAKPQRVDREPGGSGAMPSIAVSSLAMSLDSIAAASPEPELAAPASRPESRPDLPIARRESRPDVPIPRPESRPDLAISRPDSRPDVKVKLEIKLNEKFLDRYIVTAEVGRGAMGVVHRARDEKLERDVAIKEMAEDLRQYPEAFRLFRQEAKALAQLNHTNIVAMYDQVDDGDHAWMIMEFVDGRTLESILLERETLPWVEALSIVDQICAGLAFAHARKIVHRDVKPGNIFVSNDRIVKLGDFGLARVVREVSNRRTEVRGTPLYMAPEQVLGEEVDGRTDLYAIGCTLFEMTTGRPPFIDGDVRYKQVHELPPTPSSLGVALPETLEKLIMRLIDKSPAARPESAMAVRAMFKDIF